MRIKYLIIGLACSLLSNALIISHIEKRPSKCARIHIDDVNRAMNVIPDEKAAIKIARIKLSKELMDKFGLEDSIEYDVKVTYNEKLDEWCVSFRAKNVNYLDGSATIWLSGSYGIMTDFKR